MVTKRYKGGSLWWERSFPRPPTHPQGAGHPHPRAFHLSRTHALPYRARLPLGVGQTSCLNALTERAI